MDCPENDARQRAIAGKAGLNGIVCTLLLAALMFLGSTTEILAQAPDTKKTQPAALGGPNQVDNQIEDDSGVRKPLLDLYFLAAYFEFKDSLKTRTGFSFGADYSAVYLKASSSPGVDEASSGMVRVFGSWTLVGRNGTNPGALVYKVEHRHRYGTIAPSDFGFELGYVGLIEPPFSNAGLLLGNFYWRQGLAGGKITLLGGWVDPTDYIDVYGLVSPWLHFMNFAFSTGSATIPAPNQGLGLAGAAWLSSNVYAIAGFSDSNSDPTEPGDGFETFFEDKEYFKHVELGVTTAKDRAYFDNVHVTYWHADARDSAGVPDGWGLNASATYYIDNKFLPFLRGGYAKDGGSLLERSISAGFGYQRVPRQHLIGLAANWGKPNESTFAPGLDDQYTLELFLRIQLANQLAITPDVQYLINPALNPDQSSIWVFGLRGRLAL